MFESLNGALGPIYFWTFAVMALASAISLVFICRHPLSAALNLIGVMLSLAGIYALLHSPFLGVLQVLVYAGAIMMLVVFVIMVLNQAKDHQVPRFDGFSIIAIILPVTIGFSLVGFLGKQALKAEPTAVRAEIQPISASLFDMTAAGPGYYILFELIGVLLLVAVVAAVLLAKRRLDDPTPAAEEKKEDAHGHH
jgi:NADH-quinone oxidoreductase subunit J